MADTGDRHRNKHVTGVRGATPELAEQARAAAAAAGYADLSAATVNFWRWLVHDPGAQPPKRPDAGPAALARMFGEIAQAAERLYATDPDTAKAAMETVAAEAAKWRGSHA